MQYFADTLKVEDSATPKSKPGPRARQDAEDAAGEMGNFLWVNVFKK